jgi:hypothetical protein
MAVPQWQFILTDLSGNILGEITNANTRVVTLPLNQLPTCTFKIPVLHPLSPYLSDPTWDGLVKAYRTSQAGVRSLAFIGPVVTTQEVGDNTGPPMIAVSASSAMWRLSFRLLGTTATGWTMGNATTTYDLTAIVTQMLSDSNTAGYTGIERGTTATTSNGAAGTYWMKPTLDAIAEMSVGLNAFDFEVAPVEPTNVGKAWPQIGTLNTPALIGSTKSNAIFEFGTGKANVISYGRQLDRSNFLNTGYINQPAVSDHSGILSDTDAVSVAQRGVFQGLVDDGGTQWDVLRQQIVNMNVNIRTQARQVISFAPHQNAIPEPLVDYIVGDTVRCRIFVQNIQRLDADMRIWGITFNIDDLGNESPVLALIQP